MPPEKQETYAAKPALNLRRNYWLALSLTPGLGATRSRKLVKHFGDVQEIFRASLTELEAAGIPPEAAQSIALGHSLIAAEEELIRAVSAGAEIISLDDDAYPPLLRNIYDPPVVIYVRGDASILQSPGLAVVGTRHPPPYGLGVGEAWSNDRASRGVGVIRGSAAAVGTVS